VVFVLAVVGLELQLTAEGVVDWQYGVQVVQQEDPPTTEGGRLLLEVAGAKAECQMAVRGWGAYLPNSLNMTSPAETGAMPTRHTRRAKAMT
jgi:hypothetical protein